MNDKVLEEYMNTESIECKLIKRTFIWAIIFIILVSVILVWSLN